MSLLIKKFDIDVYSSLKTYPKYDLVKYVNAYGMEYYFVSLVDNNLNNLNTTTLASSNYWLGFHDINFDFSLVWVPSYNTSASQSPRIIDSSMDQGVSLVKKDGINTNVLSFKLNFENISDIEAKSLVCFFDYMGSSRAFYWTVPAPYSKKLLFSMVALQHTFVKRNTNNISLDIERSFMILGSGEGMT